MLRIVKRDGSRGGFALIVVLFGLAVVTSLAAASMTLSMGHAQDVATEKTLSERLARRDAVAELALALGSTALGQPGGVEIELGGEEVVFRLQDVGGLIDLNAAALPLIELLVADLGGAADGMGRYQAQRAAQRRILRTEEFAEMFDVPPERRADLAELTTVHSGRSGLAPEVVGEPVRELLRRRGSWNPARGGPPEDLVGPASNVNYDVQVSLDGAEWRRIATIRLGSSVGDSLVLAFD